MRGREFRLQVLLLNVFIALTARNAVMIAGYSLLRSQHDNSGGCSAVPADIYAQHESGKLHKLEVLGQREGLGESPPGGGTVSRAMQLLAPQFAVCHTPSTKIADLLICNQQQAHQMPPVMSCKKVFQLQVACVEC